MGLALPRLGRRRLPLATVEGQPTHPPAPSHFHHSLLAINNNEPEEGRDVDNEDATLATVTRQYAHYAIVGIMFPVAIMLGFFGGYMLDRWLGTVPLFALIGLLFGVAAAIRNLLQTVATDDDA